MLRKSAASRKCLASHCAWPLQLPAVFCRNHWDQLPEALREAIQRATLWGRHDEAVAAVTEAIRYLDNHKLPRRRFGFQPRAPWLGFGPLVAGRAFTGNARLLGFC